MARVLVAGLLCVSSLVLSAKPTQAYDESGLTAAADEAGVGVEDLRAALNTTGMEPYPYLYATGELAPPKPPPMPYGIWDRLAQCEAHGVWSANTGNGFSGGLQFTRSTWRDNGGSGEAWQASREAQIRVAQRVLATQGAKAWPVCSYTAGLR